jgi:hypothetical protein
MYALHTVQVLNANLSQDVVTNLAHEIFNTLAAGKKSVATKIV